MSDTTTIHRHGEGGPEASITCADDGASVAASWVVPTGQTLVDHPELNTGGYVYFTLDATPTVTLNHPADAIDFAGALFDGDHLPITASSPVDPGVAYRAHILIAYEDGPAWHNDTVFTCEPVEAAEAVTAAPSEVVATTLPYTGAEPMLGILGGLALVLGAIALKISTRIT